MNPHVLLNTLGFKLHSAGQAPDSTQWIGQGLSVEIPNQTTDPAIILSLILAEARRTWQAEARQHLVSVFDPIARI